MNAHPTELVANMVGLLRLFDGLVSDELEGDEARVFAHADAFPGDNLETAILNMAHPSVMVVYMGLVRGELARNEVIKHKLSLYIRGREVSAPVSGAHNIIYQIENGTDQNGNTFRNAEIHEECYPIGRDLEVKRLIKMPNDIDIWEMTCLLTEVGG